MALQELANAIPEAAKDLRLNLTAIPQTATLTPQQLWTVALASAFATRNAAVVAAVGADARAQLSDAAVAAAKTAAALMGMNNVYYRFVHLVGDAEYERMPARLRMQGLARPGIDAVDFELACLAVSAIHGCGMCMASHAGHVVTKGATKASAQDAVRIAAILHGVAVALDLEAHSAGMSAGTAAR